MRFIARGEHLRADIMVAACVKVRRLLSILVLLFVCLFYWKNVDVFPL